MHLFFKQNSQDCNSLSRTRPSTYSRHCFWPRVWNALIGFWHRSRATSLRTTSCVTWNLLKFLFAGKKSPWFLDYARTGLFEISKTLIWPWSYSELSSQEWLQEVQFWMVLARTWIPACQKNASPAVTYAPDDERYTQSISSPACFLNISLKQPQLTDGN